MHRIYFTIPGKPKPQKRHSPQRPPQKVWHLIAQAKALGVKLVSVMNRDPSAQDKREFNIQSRRYAPKEPIVGPVLLYVVFYMPVPKGAVKRIREYADFETEDSRPPLEIAMHQTFSCARPEAYRIGEQYHTKRPDVDNLLKLVKDSLTGLMWVDDSQVQIGGAFKVYSHKLRTEIELYWG